MEWSRIVLWILKPARQCLIQMVEKYALRFNRSLYTTSVKWHFSSFFWLIYTIFDHKHTKKMVLTHISVRQCRNLLCNICMWNMFYVICQFSNPEANAKRKTAIYSVYGAPNNRHKHNSKMIHTINSSISKVFGFTECIQIIILLGYSLRIW